MGNSTIYYIYIYIYILSLEPQSTDRLAVQESLVPAILYEESRLMSLLSMSFRALITWVPIVLTNIKGPQTLLSYVLPLKTWKSASSSRFLSEWFVCIFMSIRWVRSTFEFAPPKTMKSSLAPLKHVIGWWTCPRTTSVYIKKSLVTVTMDLEVPERPIFMLTVFNVTVQWVLQWERQKRFSCCKC